MKRIFSLFAIVAFSCGMLVGCGNPCKDLQKKMTEQCAKMEGDAKKVCEDNLGNAGYDKMPKEACEAALKALPK